MKIDKLFTVAKSIAQFSHDQETQVGAILVSKDTGAILSTGYNGFVRGANDCALPNSRPDKYKYIIHAEVNLLLNAARHGICTSNCYLVCTLSPCINCLRQCWQAGIDTLYFAQKYRDFDENINMKDLSATIEKEGIYWKITLKGAKL